MPQPTGDPVTFHGRPDGLTDNQSDVWRCLSVAAVIPPEVNDDVGLCQANPMLQRRVELN